MPEKVEEEKEPIEFVSTTENLKSITQELLEQVLPFIKEQFKSEGKNLELAILNQALQVQENELVVEVMGHVQEEIAQKMKPELIRLIRERAGVGQFTFSIVTKEEIATQSSKLYTDSDKFRFLTEKHPALKEFSKRFGLETDY